MSVPPSVVGAVAPVPPVAISPGPLVPTPGLSMNEEHVLFDHVDRYLLIGQESDASDIHLGVNMPPIWRRNGLMEPIFRQAPRLAAAGH